jgi:hypothetical protein
MTTRGIVKALNKAENISAPHLEFGRYDGTNTPTLRSKKSFP